FFDFDNDGWMDILLVQGSTVERARSANNPHSAIFRNRGDGTFEDVTEKAGLTSRGWGMGVTFADYNNDSFTDVYLTRLGPNVLYRNNGDGTFNDVTEKAGVGDPRWSTSAAFGDYDQDGDLDLYVANYLDVGVDKLPPRRSERCTHLGRQVMCGPRGLPGAPDVLYRNNGDGTFSDVTEESGAVDRDRYFGLGVVWADIDNDRDLDLYVANDATPNLVFVNQGNGTFKEMGYLSGLAVSGHGMEQASMGVDIADYDNDGLLDVFLTHFSNDYNTLYHNEGDLWFKHVEGQSHFQSSEWHLVSWGTRFVDLNHDGWKDIFFANGHVYPFLLHCSLAEAYHQPCSFYSNQRDGTFRNASREAGPDIQKETVSRGVAFSDWDNDGDIDFIIANLNDWPQLFRNDLADQNHWVMFRTVGERSNRDGIGTRITVVTGELRQIWEIKRTVSIYSASDPRAHFGLGSAAKVDLLKVQWPSGEIQEFKNIPADFHYLIHEKEGLSKESIRRE
ncbi:CRTAC1 family protein, partial [Acidobacteria bacterium AH-259-L09]|nr:CRTAC1 family protein [Acidobacteria bacterium AH-259-L09]